jgi:hypothetical protein
MGFKRLVSGIKDSNRTGSLQIAYCWIKSWLYILETREELTDSQNQFHHWLRSEQVVEELGSVLIEKLDGFSINSILATHAHWAKHSVNGKITLATNTTSASESIHSSVKNGFMATNPMQNLDESARRQVTKSDQQLRERRATNHCQLGKTPLWLKEEDKLPLTTYAGNLNASMLDGRHHFGVIQGTLSFRPHVISHVINIGNLLPILYS